MWHSFLNIAQAKCILLLACLKVEPTQNSLYGTSILKISCIVVQIFWWNIIYPLIISLVMNSLLNHVLDFGLSNYVRCRQKLVLVKAFEIKDKGCMCVWLHATASSIFQVFDGLISVFTFLLTIWPCHFVRSYQCVITYWSKMLFNYFADDTHYIVRVFNVLWCFNMAIRYLIQT